MTPTNNTPVQADALEAVNTDSLLDMVEKRLKRAREEMFTQREKADDSLKIALELLSAHRLAHQPTTDAEAEPVALQYQFAPGLRWHAVDYQDQVPRGPDFPTIETRPLYAHPPADKARIAALEAVLRRIGNSAPNHCACCTHMGHTARAALENRHAKD